MAQAVRPQGGVTNAILKAVGREQGPDYMLKFTPPPAQGQPGLLDLPANTPILPDSSITELLNVVSYLCSNTRDESLIDAANSVAAPAAGPAIGAHDVGGLYVVGGGAIANTLILSTAGNVLFNLDDLTPNGNVQNRVIPVGILRRTIPAANADPSWDVQPPHPVGTDAEVTSIMSACVKQMINVLIHTRAIFGPKGWTELFQKVKGGGSSRSKNAKRTHRHRRRYSSKQY